jgi:hypothetical protein
VHRAQKRAPGTPQNPAINKVKLANLLLVQLIGNTTTSDQSPKFNSSINVHLRVFVMTDTALRHIDFLPLLVSIPTRSYSPSLELLTENFDSVVKIWPLLRFLLGYPHQSNHEWMNWIFRPDKEREDIMGVKKLRQADLRRF